MSDETFETEFTKTSSKGQIVIPSKIRKKLNIVDGSLLAVTAQDDLIILKKVSSNISSKDMITLRLIEEAWKDIDKGKYKVRSKNDFFNELREW
ncbi:MAG: AbrB/MazE/SpoVT family DNA-binding domain-containing protein [Thermoplasmataceae archaeon]